MTETRTNLLRGALDVLILRALADEPRHGYGVAEWIETATDETVLLEEGTLYPALHRLDGKGWLRAEWGRSENNRRAKFYRLTPTGRRHLETELRVWEQYTSAIRRALTIPSS